MTGGAGGESGDVDSTGRDEGDLLTPESKFDGVSARGGGDDGVLTGGEGAEAQVEFEAVHFDLITDALVDTGAGGHGLVPEEDGEAIAAGRVSAIGITVEGSDLGHKELHLLPADAEGDGERRTLRGVDGAGDFDERLD